MASNEWLQSTGSKPPVTQNWGTSVALPSEWLKIEANKVPAASQWISPIHTAAPAPVAASQTNGQRKSISGEWW